jgi:hypothetical protein
MNLRLRTYSRKHGACDRAQLVSWLFAKVFVEFGDIRQALAPDVWRITMTNTFYASTP